MNPIGSNIFNFNKFVNNLDVKTFLDDNSTLACDCTCSPFVDNDHNHIITDHSKKLLITKSYANFSLKVQRYHESKSADFPKA